MGPSLIGDGNMTEASSICNGTPASMGPSLIGDGNPFYLRSILHQWSPLQWGRP